MSSLATKVEMIDFSVTRPASVRLMIAQAAWPASQWREEAGLFFHENIRNAQEALERALSYARQSAVEIVVLPELSLPQECIDYARKWSEQAGSVVIAGSHYVKTERGYISRCPVLVGGRLFFVEKSTPAPAEVSPVGGEGLQHGNKLVSFKNSPVGNFGVLICSDYLDSNVKKLLPLSELDLLVVPAFQRNSDAYHVRMNIDCEESGSGLYIAYANTLSNEYGDGRSAFFGLMDNMFTLKLEKAGYTDRKPQSKLCELSSDQSFMVVEFDLLYKKPFAKRTVLTRPNVRIISVDRKPAEVAETIEQSGKLYTETKEPASVTINHKLAVQQNTNSPKRSHLRGVPQEILTALRQALIACDEFSSSQQLRAVFSTEKLTPWQSRIPDATSVSDRVDLVVGYLISKYLVSGENALVILTTELSARYDPTDARHSRLAELANNLERTLG
jgi:hypothetical protein